MKLVTVLPQNYNGSYTEFYTVSASHICFSLPFLNVYISRRRSKDNIRTDYKKIGWGGVDWIHLAQDRDHDNEPSGS
jgi:hypothetical protein